VAVPLLPAFSWLVRALNTTGHPRTVNVCIILVQKDIQSLGSLVPDKSACGTSESLQFSISFVYFIYSQQKVEHLVYFIYSIRLFVLCVFVKGTKIKYCVTHLFMRKSTWKHTSPYLNCCCH
jgi:hypothetical protein